MRGLQVAASCVQALATSSQQALVLQGQNRGAAVHVLPADLAASIKEQLAGIDCDVTQALPAGGAVDNAASDEQPDVSGRPDQLRQALAESAGKIGLEDMPLVMSRGKPSPFVASLDVLPYSQEALSGIWLKVLRFHRHCIHVLAAIIAYKCWPQDYNAKQMTLDASMHLRPGTAHVQCNMAFCRIKTVQTAWIQLVRPRS